MPKRDLMKRPVTEIGEMSNRASVEKEVVVPRRRTLSDSSATSGVSYYRLAMDGAMTAVSSL